ncbi:MAG: carbonic anhydrase [Bryobacteraceae bacterium]
MNRLIAGYKRFRETGWPLQRRAFENLAQQGQKPKALVLACVDSRVDPAMIFDTAPGEVLTVRNVANLVPPYAPDASYHGTSAALEFGVNALQVPHLIVLGHGLCGGVKALIEGAPPSVQEFVGPWMSIASGARELALREADTEARQMTCEHEVVKVSLANLMSFPWIAERVASGSLQLHGAWFNIHTGTLLILRPDGTFGPPE